MSFLLPLDDERETLATLEEALALIDASDHEPKEEFLCVDHTQLSERKKSARNGTKKMAHQDRVKAELEQLRHEATALELWAMRLKMTHAGAGFAAHLYGEWRPTKATNSHYPAASPQWMEAVVREFRRRKLSETRNRKLKALLKRLQTTAKSSEQALVNRLTEEEILLIYEPTDTAPNRIKQPDDEEESLVGRLDHLELNLVSLLERAGLDDQESCIFHTQRKVEQTLGPVFECASSTPLPHSIADTDSVFHQKSDNDANIKSDPSLTSYQATFQLDGQTYVTRGLMRKRVGPDQIVYMWSSVSRLTDKGLTLKEEGITRIFRPSPPHSASLESTYVASQLQTWYIAYMAQQSDGSVAASSAGKLLRFHTNRLTTLLQKLTEILQDESQGRAHGRSACHAAAAERIKCSLKTRNGSRQSLTKHSSASRDIVSREFKRRKQSETVNRELKALLARIEKTSSITAGALETVLMEKNLALLLDPKPTRGSISGNSMDSLQIRIDRLALNTDWHLDRSRLNDSDSFTFRTQRVVDPSSGSAFEIVMNSSLPCSKEHALLLIERSFCSGGEHRNRQEIIAVENATESTRSSEKSVRFGHQQYKMKGVCARRKLHEAQRNRFLWSTLSCLPNAAASFREDCIMALQTTSVSPAACQLQIWYRVRAELSSTPNTDSPTDPESEMLKESVLRSHCRTTGEFFQSVEKILADKVFSPHA